MNKHTHLERIRTALGIDLGTSLAEVLKRYRIDSLCRSSEVITLNKLENHIRDKLYRPGDIDLVLAALNVGDSDTAVSSQTICGSLHFICGEGRVDDDVFTFIDANRDGHISFEELESFFRGLFATAFAFSGDEKDSMERKLGCTSESLAIELTRDVFTYVSKHYELDEDTLDTVTMSYDAAKRVLRNRGFFDATLLMEAILKQKQLRDEKNDVEDTTTKRTVWWTDLSTNLLPQE
jgi:hypothetical protein